LKKKILLAVIALIVLCVLGGGGFFGYKWWARRKAAQAAAQAAEKPAPAPGQDDDEDEPESSGGEKEGASGPAVLQLKGLIVNLDSPRKNAWLKCEIDILFRDQELGKLAASDKPTPENSLIRSIVLEAVSGKSVDVAMDVESRESVRQEIKDKLNEKFANHRSKEALAKAKKSGKPLKPPIKDVLVVEWAIQQ
jgi:flagellar basal body-associated protein FliL